jgi:hypothetical protein
LQKNQFSSLEQFRPPPNKSGSKPDFSPYLFLSAHGSKNAQNRPKMAYFTLNSFALKIGKVLEQWDIGLDSDLDFKNSFYE